MLLTLTMFHHTKIIKHLILLLIKDEHYLERYGKINLEFRLTLDNFLNDNLVISL